MMMYNPTHGKLFEVDEKQPVSPKRVRDWELSHESPERGLTLGELNELQSNGKIGFYPDEFFLVGTMKWSLEKVRHHQQMVQAFERVNENGPVYPHWDSASRLNTQERIIVSLVPGPVIIYILNASRDSAIDHVYRVILNSVAVEFRLQREFQEKAMKHASNIVDAVREADAGKPSSVRSGKSTRTDIRDKVVNFLSRRKEPLRPAEIAAGTGLNKNTVRRELQQMLKKGAVTRLEHDYLVRERKKGK